MSFAANIAVVIVDAIMIVFFFNMHASDVYQHTFNRSRVATLR